jgi:hypothetical protein
MPNTFGALSQEHVIFVLLLIIVLRLFLLLVFLLLLSGGLWLFRALTLRVVIKWIIAIAILYEFDLLLKSL